MQKHLKEIASVKTGQTFRVKVVNEPAGEVLAIQVKDLNHHSDELIGKPHRLTLDKVSESQLLHKGDVLFLARGVNNKAFVYSRVDKAVAASFFMVIQADDKIIDPHYLAWFINQKETQAEIQRYRQGSITGSILKAAVENLMITIPSMDIQKRIAKVDEFARKEKEISLELIELKKVLIEHSLIQRIK